MPIGTPEILVILLIVVLLFGAKRLPDTARGLGRSLRIFKAETKGLTDDDASSAAGQSGRTAGEGEAGRLPAAADTPEKPAATEQSPRPEG